MTHAKLPRSPLVLVAAQIRFSPIENVERKYIPEIQERLRMLGFPRYGKTIRQQIVATPTGLQAIGIEQWRFTDKVKSTTIVVQKDSLSIAVVDYSTFVEFIGRIQPWITCISDILGLCEFNVLEQVSLRYVDWIVPVDGQSPESLIREDYLGGFNKSDDVVSRRQILVDKVTEIGVIRIILFKPSEQDEDTIKADFPEDINVPDIPQGHVPLILDMGHVTNKGYLEDKDYSDELVRATLEKLHEESDRLFFERISTPEAIGIWGKDIHEQGCH